MRSKTKLKKQKKPSAKDKEKAPSTTDPNAAKPNKKSAADFEFLEVLGQGAFGEVKRVREKKTGREFAAKMLQKTFIVESKKSKYVHTERNIFNALSHPNVVKLYFTFQDPKTLYYILELCPNGDLLTQLKKYGQFSQASTRFYAAELVSALEHMHSKGIMHRDLKPDNVLLDPNMHSKLTDFGTGKIIEGTDETSQRARADSFVGTADYVSPELLGDDAYACKSSDLWALGCIIYQMLYGKTPFKAETNHLTFENTRNRAFSFPDDASDEAEDLIDKLLVINPDDRLGANPDLGFKPLKSHQFFASIDWDNLPKTNPPPFSKE